MVNMKKEKYLKEKNMLWKILNSWWIVLMFFTGGSFIVRVGGYIASTDSFLYSAAFEVYRSNIGLVMIYPICWGILYAVCLDQTLAVLFWGSAFLAANTLVLFTLDSGRGNGIRELLLVMTVAVTFINVTAAIVFWKRIMNRLAYVRSDAARREREKKRQVYFEEAMREVRAGWR